MEVSVVIPTFNREKDLESTLRQILGQTISPKEVIVVDDSDTDNSEKLIQKLKPFFLEKCIDLIYLRNTKERSSAAARNLGADHAKAEILLFMDDDVILNETYFKKMLEIYDNEEVIGVQGYVIEDNLIRFRSSAIAKMINSLQRLFYLHHYERNRCRVLQSGETTYPHYLDNIQNCQWLSGTNQSLRKDVFLQFKFDEKLKKYSLGEDMDLSYRVWKVFPRSLFITPSAVLYHKISRKSRLEDKAKIQMRMAYSTYLFYKNIENTTFNQLIFFWSKLGGLIFGLGGAMISMKNQKDLGLRKIDNIIHSYIFTMQHLKEIKEGKFGFCI